ncbi:MAG: GTPase domain-containing protein [Planctomycetota bacterium]|nr:GTPase domain-containing protein [Planctomycetota bacterium]
MGIGSGSLETLLGALDAKVSALKPRAGGHGTAIDRWRADAAAAAFHLGKQDARPMIVAILGGTGTGKSTLVNRLVGANLSAASFRRTFTAGPVAICGEASNILATWLGVAHTVVGEADLPARGQTDTLIVVQGKNDLLGKVTLVDTPDLDGDQPAHHAQADRTFRWAEAVLFLVSPEKYQMTELLPYYRLSKRYGLPALFAMNKCETPEMLEDYRRLVEAQREGSQLFAIARDDAAYEPPAEANMSALQSAIAAISVPPAAQRQAGASMRLVDLLGRFRDQLIEPMRNDRRDVDICVKTLRAIETPAPGVDVNPITEQLQRRLQQRSVLYLIGPGRILDRVRQMPGMLVRLPRTAWDVVIRGKPIPAAKGAGAEESRELPDFGQTLVDQFIIVQSRIDDTLRETPAGQKWLGTPDNDYASSKINPAEAGKIAIEELDALKNWLQKRWNATPRDTALLLKLLRHLPGGEKLTQWTEAAPYLLAIIVAAHHAFFGHIDLMILGGYSLATWITERMSNEVASRTRLSNRIIAARFEKLAHEQIRRSMGWLEAQAPSEKDLNALSTAADALEESLQS